MARNFVDIDRQTRFLLPPDIREWIREDDLVHFVIEAVEGMNLSHFHVNKRGSGKAQYPPRMMLSLLIYCYSMGIFSSRRIESATYRDLSVRYLCANTHPDHDTICSFRKRNFELISEAFLEVLKLAKKLKLLKVGTVSVDGTHIQASASKYKNVKYGRAGDLVEQLELDIAELMKQAEAADSAEEADGQSLPEELSRRENLKAKLEKARSALEKEAKKRAEIEREEYEEKVARREKRKGRAKGKEIQKAREVPDESTQVNLTDTDSKLMRKNKREGYTQSYNGQIAVDADGSQLILSAHISTSANDVHELLPTVESIDAKLGKPDTVLADTGYANADAFEELEDQDVEPIVSISKDESHTKRQYEFRPETKPSQKKVTDPKLVEMQEKFDDEEVRLLYQKRKQTVEPVFGIIKQALGFRQFLTRGVKSVTNEWKLVALAYNFKRLHALQAA